MSQSNNTEERTLMQQWQKNIRIYQIAHLRASASCNSTGRLLGLMVTIFTAIVGTSIFASLSSSHSQVILIVVGVVSLIATLLSAMHGFLNYGERSEKHQAAGIKYGSLRRRIDETLVTLTQEAELEKAIAELRREIDQLESDSPVVPQKYIDIAMNMVDSKKSKQTDPASLKPVA